MQKYERKSLKSKGEAFCNSKNLNFKLKISVHHKRYLEGIFLKNSNVDFSCAHRKQLNFMVYQEFKANS